MSQPDPTFEELLQVLRDGRGFDYTQYRRPSLMRRFEKRMQAVGIETFDQYRDYLEANPDEYSELFNTILINVTGFFRDKEAWDLLASEVLPTVIEAKAEEAPIRVWSAGCASGEEPYTIAMLLCEALGEDGFRERAKIYATDIDDHALAQAREALFTAKQLEAVPTDLREKYFPQVNHSFAFRNDVRRAVIFGRNDLIQDPPISRVDLLVCRNTLMYFAPPAQERMLSNFYFALTPGGFLMVGKAEALQSRTHLFEAYDLKRRVFVKDHQQDRGFRLPRPPVGVPAAVAPVLAALPLAETAFEHASNAQVVVDLEGRIASVNHAARALFGLKGKDVGRPVQDVELSYRPIELRSLLDDVRTERKVLTRKDVSWAPQGGEARMLDVQLAPLTSHTGEFVGIVVTFVDVTPQRAMQAELEAARRELETAYEELQSTVEELETTNEELQSTNEELETTNEELQSTNEELETMNEELQSTNEELETMNDELRERTDEALRANTFLSAILSGIHQSVIVVDRQLRVTAWSRAAAELWGLRADEVQGEHFLNLDIGIPVGELGGPLRAALAGEETQEMELVGHNRRGQAIRVLVSLAELPRSDGEPDGLIVAMTAERDDEETAL
jgi:two-component system, chemotaxis family, CheB/CheR fusion protein